MWIFGVSVGLNSLQKWIIPIEQLGQRLVDNGHTMSYIFKMNQIFNFDPEKNTQLIKSRNISFEEIIAVLGSTGPKGVTYE